MYKRQLLIFAGAFNGLILPIGFGVVLWAATMRSDLLHGYKFPKVLLAIGFITWIVTVWLGWQSFSGITELWN